jgi:hypothetical protein
VELAVLSAVVHGNDSPEVVLRALEAVNGSASLDDVQRGAYSDLVYSALGSATRAAVEAAMSQGNYEYRTDFAKRYLAQGRAEGRAEGEAHALLRLLAARGFVVDEATAARVRACMDVEALGRWIDRAATAATLETVFDDA